MPVTELKVLNVAALLTLMSVHAIPPRTSKVVLGPVLAIPTLLVSEFATKRLLLTSMPFFTTKSLLLPFGFTLPQFSFINTIYTAAEIVTEDSVDVFPPKDVVLIVTAPLV